MVMNRIPEYSVPVFSTNWIPCCLYGQRSLGRFLCLLNCQPPLGWFFCGIHLARLSSSLRSHGRVSFVLDAFLTVQVRCIMEVAIEYVVGDMSERKEMYIGCEMTYPLPPGL